MTRRVALRECILEFNRGAEFYNNQRYSEAIPIIRQSTVLFRRFQNEELIMYSYELLAKSYERTRQFDEANKCWIFCVIYSLQNDTTEKLAHFIERFCKLKYRFSLKMNRRYSSLSRILNDSIVVPLASLFEEVRWYQELKMKEDEEEVIGILIERSKEENDMFYLGGGYILKGLLEEKKVRIKTEGSDIVEQVLAKFFQSDESIVDVYKYLKMGIDIVRKNEEIDEHLENYLFSASLFYFHQGKYRAQIDVLNMLRGSPNDARRMKYNCYIARTLISIGSVKDGEKYLKENENILLENNQNLDDSEEEEDIFEITSSPKSKRNQSKNTKNEREWCFSKIFFVLIQGYYFLEINEYHKSKEKLESGSRMIDSEKRVIRRTSTSKLSPVVRNGVLSELERLRQLQLYYLLTLSIRYCEIQKSLSLSHELLESQKTSSSILPRYIPHHQLFMVVGDAYEQLGFLKKANFYYYLGVQSGIYTRTRLGVSNFLLRLAKLEKNRLRFDVAEKHFHVLTCLFDGDNIHEPLLEDDLDQIGISYLFFLFERSDFYFKLQQYPNCQDFYSFAMKSMHECYMWKRANCCEVVELCSLAKEYESQLSNFDGNVEKSRGCLEVILKSPFVPPSTNARILGRLSQSYLGKRYLFEDNEGRDNDEFFGRSGGSLSMDNKNRRDSRNLNLELELVAPSSIPSITKPTYSALGCISYHLRDQLKSCYYSNMSMGIRMRHEKLDVLRRRIEEKKKNRKRVPSLLQKMTNSLSFPEEASTQLLKDITNALPSDIEVFSICLSHDSTSILITHMKSKQIVSTREVPLVYKRKSFKKFRKRYSKRKKSNPLNRRRRKRGGKSSKNVDPLATQLINFLKKYEKRHRVGKDKHWYISENLTRRSDQHLSVDDETGMNQIIGDRPKLLDEDEEDEDDGENAFSSSYTSSATEDEEEEEEKKEEREDRQRRVSSKLNQNTYGNIVQEEESTLFFAICELEDILKESNLSLHESEFVTSSFQKKRWWNTRHELNERMRELTRFLQLAMWSPPNSTLMKSDGLPGHPEVTRPSQGSHVILVLDKVLHQFPWEMMPLFSGSSVSRVPSLMFLYSQLLQTKKKKPKVDPHKTMFIVNPDKTLQKTEKKFRKDFSSFLDGGGWKGWMGVSPTNGEFLSTIQESDTLIYMGHGGGESFIHSQDIVELERNCKIAFLMGCSSGQLMEQGIYEPTGTPLKYLNSGCLCVVANLWEVTDKDCSRWSCWMIKEWITGEEGKNVSQLMPEAREKCVLKYLIGGAAVVFGLPL